MATKESDGWKRCDATRRGSYPRGAKPKPAARPPGRRWAWRLVGPRSGGPATPPADRGLPSSGTMQLLVVSFPGCDPYRRQFEREAESVTEWGTVRLVDRLFLFKDAAGDVALLTDEAERGEPVLRMLLGASEGSVIRRPTLPLAPLCTPGVTSDEVWELVDGMRPGTGLGLALYGQLWSDRLLATMKTIGGLLIDLSPLAADDVDRIRH